MSNLEDKLGYKFQNMKLLQQAITHASAIAEKHPMAYHRELTPLAFVGDATLKYAVTRYLFLNGRDDVITSRGELHRGTQAIITNDVLAAIGSEKLHLEDYVIRGNGLKTLSKMIYADCMEAIFGAIALDCGSDGQERVFRVIEQLCSQCYQPWLDETSRFRFLSRFDDREGEWITNDIIAWPKMQLQSSRHELVRATPAPQEESCCRFLCRLCWGFFGIVGFITICCLVIAAFVILFPEKRSPSRWFDL
jgi:dsRNA-specific ribonuclease